MRPRRVVMQAFGPYAHRQVVDFSELAGQSFFLVHGPTGAGKTTILDAMTFALFGVTSGDERHADDMRSHHAAAGTPTEVEFEFSIGPQQYLIHRSPEQQRPKQRGTGFTSQLKEATLWRLADRTPACPPPADDAEPASPSPHRGAGSASSSAPSPADDSAAEARTVLASRWSRVTEKCEELLGFKAAQFRQVVLLPQGRFQELLRSESRQRQEILETLFQTQIYRRIEEELKARAKSAGELVERKRHEWEVVLRQAETASEDDLRQRRELLSSALQQARTARLTCEQAKGAARLVCDQARESNQKLDDLVATQAYSQHVEERSAQVDAARGELDWARRSEQLVGPQRLVEERRADLQRAQEGLAEAQKTAARATEEHRLAEAELQREESDVRASERTRLQEEVRHLTDLVARAADLADAEDRQKTAAEALALADDRAQAATSTAEKVAADKTEAEEALRGAQHLATRLPDLKAVADRSAERARVLDRLQDADAALATADLRVAEAEAAHQRALVDHEGATRAAADLERAWAEGQAALLAADLQPGAPCPVCGSTDHPAPALAEAMVPGQPDVEAARGGAVEALRVLRTAEQALHQARNETAEHKATVTSCRELLGNTAAHSAEQLVAEAQAAGQQWTAASAAAESLGRLSDAAQGAVQAAAEAAAVAESAAAEQVTARSAAAAAAALVAERAGGLPAELRTEGSLQAATAEAQRRSKDARLAHEHAQHAERSAAEARTSAAASLAGAEAAVAHAQTALAEAQAQFGDRVGELGFADELALQTARRDADQTAALQEQIKNHDDDRAAAADRLSRATAATQGLERADLESLLQSLTGAETAANEAVAAASSLQEQLNQADGWLAALTAIATQLAEQEAVYSVVGRLSRVANGDNQLRLSFQRFVLGALLDDVLVAATRRLAIMSRGRYVLQRADELRDGRKAAGLDLTVLDEWTGMQRPVSTLSGGETFLAALSLALGLAEVVQAYAGGIRLDTVFVDEGFGSLDEEALAAALEALTGLQQGGRLVGIISHVSELQEQIDARLQITAGRTGSSARFIVP